ncbi:MAG: LysR family transcriptional regulator [Phormidesmis sp.]
MAGKQAKTLSEKVKLSQLRALGAVATTGSFSEAALQLNVSQSTVSHSIAALEDALGVVLIHRGRQRASLTPVGDRIFTQSQQILGLVADMGQEASRARGVDGGLVRIAAFRSLASEVLPGAIAHLHEHHPTVQIVIIEFDNTQSLIDAVVEGKADLCMADLLLQGDEFETFKIMDDPFVALIPPNRLDIQTQLTWEDLRQNPLITSPNECCKVITNCLKAARPPIGVDYLIANDSTAVSMARQGLGIAVLPRLAAQPIPKGVRIAQLPFDMARPLGLSWLRKTLLTPATYAFLDAFRHLYAEPHRDLEDTRRYGVEREHPLEAQDFDEKTAISATRHH